MPIKERPSGKIYEFQVMKFLTERDQGVDFQLDAKVPDRTQSYLRQVDIWLPRTREIVECKHFSRRVSISVIDALFGAIHDIGASGGQVFSHSGFTKTALERAEKAGIKCTELRFEKTHQADPEPTGYGHYWGDIMDLCAATTSQTDYVARVNYNDGRGCESPICVGRSVDWHNPQVHRFIAYIVLTHSLEGKTPTEQAVASCAETLRERFDVDEDWRISEGEVTRSRL